MPLYMFYLSMLLGYPMPHYLSICFFGPKVSPLHFIYVAMCTKKQLIKKLTIKIMYCTT